MKENLEWTSRNLKIKGLKKTLGLTKFQQSLDNLYSIIIQDNEKINLLNSEIENQVRPITYNGSDPL